MDRRQRRKHPAEACQPEAAAAEEEEEEEISLECPICLALLFRPVTLGCGHNFCEDCLHKAMADGSQRCATCRCPLPSGGALEPNRLLAALVRAREPQAYEAQQASSGPCGSCGAPRPQPRMESLRWTLAVDYLSVASLIVLVVGRRVGVPLEATCTERPMRWCDDKRRPEWQKDAPEDAVPCLQGSPGRGGGEVALVQPAAILSTVLSVWGGGKLRPPFAAGPLALAKHDELVARAWEAVVRPIALHLFSTCWDGMLAFPVIKETVQALIWVDAHVCAAAEFPREPSKLTLLHVVAAVPCLLLLTLGMPMQSKDGAQQHTSFVIEAMQAMPRFRAWMRAAYAMLGADVEALSQRSPQYRHYRENLAGKELGSLLMAGTGFGAAGLACLVGGAPSKPAKMPSWPYSNLGSLGSRDSAFTKELPFDEYRRRGEGEEGDEGGDAPSDESDW